MAIRIVIRGRTLVYKLTGYLNYDIWFACQANQEIDARPPRLSSRWRAGAGCVSSYYLDRITLQRRANKDKQDYLFPVNQSRGTRDLNPVKTYNYIPIRSGFRKELYQNYFLDLNNSSAPKFVIFLIIHSILIGSFIDLERV